MGAKVFLEPISEPSSSSSGFAVDPAGVGLWAPLTNARGWGRAGPGLEPCLGLHLPGASLCIQDPMKEPATLRGREHPLSSPHLPLDKEVW